MTPLQTILWLEKAEKDMMKYETCKPDLYGKESWWRIAHEKAMTELSDMEMDEYNRLLGGSMQ